MKLRMGMKNWFVETFYSKQFLYFRTRNFKKSFIWKKMCLLILKVESKCCFYYIIQTFIQHAIFLEFRFMILLFKFFESFFISYI